MLRKNEWVLSSVLLTVMFEFRTTIKLVWAEVDQAACRIAMSPLAFEKIATGRQFGHACCKGTRSSTRRVRR